MISPLPMTCEVDDLKSNVPHSVPASGSLYSIASNFTPASARISAPLNLAVLMMGTQTVVPAFRLLSLTESGIVTYSLLFKTIIVAFAPNSFEKSYTSSTLEVYLFS